MPSPPRISIVTASHNQGQFIGRTIESVLAQRYPNLEHIVVDGMSTDETPAILARYGHLRVIREPDKGQADAINKGFRIATGDIFGFLNSDDTLMPGALDRVAHEIDPTRGRHIVLGRCRFIDEHDRFSGVEHPSAFESHRRVLEIWKGYSIPQPAVFWTAEVWRRCGPLNEREQLMLDYDLFCRFSREYRFHAIDQVLATYRMHSESKTSSVSDAERLEQAIQVSRRYWGSPATLQFWQLQLSYAQFRLGRRRRALALLREAREAWRHARRPRALAYAAGGALLGPDIVTDAVLFPALKPRLRRVWAAGRLRPTRPATLHPYTLAWRDFDAQHADGWVGPQFKTTVTVEPGQTRCEVEGSTGGFDMPVPLELTIAVDGREVGTQRPGGGGEFVLVVPLAGLEPGAHELTIASNTFVVPFDYVAAEDYRPLAFKLRNIRLN
ncbi:MAG: glycosyltransferase family 2 protein [Vicinamibacterales bacterium]